LKDEIPEKRHKKAEAVYKNIAHKVLQRVVDRPTLWYCRQWQCAEKDDIMGAVGKLCRI